MTRRRKIERRKRRPGIAKEIKTKKIILKNIQTVKTKKIPERENIGQRKIVRKQ